MISALYHSLGIPLRNPYSPLLTPVIFLAIYTVPTPVSPNGVEADLATLSTIVATGGIWALVGKGMLAANHFTWPFWLSNFISFVAPLVLFAAEANIVEVFTNYYGVRDVLTKYSN